jgi:hypothetical protein
MISFRPSTPDDRRFVVSSWSSSYKNSHTAGMIYTDDYADVMHRQIERILDRPDARTVVAFESKDTSFLYGWICGDTSEHVPAIFYCYVKEPYRRAGHARKLFEAFGVKPAERFVYACKTAIVPTLARSIPAARFNPAIIRYPKERRA